ncbi:MAG TPA: ABC transporter permease [Flavisolibacter sp.]|jgi:ABC-type transport system involved in multi-copper enzyme maturation permease subunit|nr:ABC transporter permease [Flavisolibacter sp.]
MSHLLKIEWLKLKNYRTFWILTILFIISIFGINYIVHEIFGQKALKNPAATMFVGGPPFQFPQVWQSVTFVSGFLLFIPGLLMVISITNEYSFKTHRQNIIDGLSRTQFILIKMLLAVILSMFSTLCVFITALLFGLTEGGASLSFDGLVYVGYFFIQALSYSFLAILVSLLFKRSGVSIGVFFLYAIVLENMLAGLLNNYTNHTGYFLPLKSGNTLIPFPFFRTITKNLMYQPEVKYLLLTAVVYLIFYFFFSKRRFETVDL